MCIDSAQLNCVRSSHNLLPRCYQHHYSNVPSTVRCISAFTQLGLRIVGLVHARVHMPVPEKSHLHASVPPVISAHQVLAVRQLAECDLEAAVVAHFAYVDLETRALSGSQVFKYEYHNVTCNRINEK